MDAMSGWGELGDRGLVADFYGLGERAEYRTERTRADRAHSRADVADWRIGWTGRTPSYWAEYRTRRTGADGADWGGLGRLAHGADGANWGRRGGPGRTRRTGQRGAYGASLGGRKERTGKPGAGLPVDWADRLECALLGRLASLRLRVEGIPAVLSPDADCGIIWLYIPGIHIRFFGAHVVVIFLGTHTSKAQRASTGDKFFGLLGALNITYSMFIQMGHAISDVVIVTYKGGLSSLVPPSPLCTSCCS